VSVASQTVVVALIVGYVAGLSAAFIYERSRVPLRMRVVYASGVTLCVTLVGAAMFLR
jgi:hypothetical protein